MYFYIIIILLCILFFYKKREYMCNVNIREPILANPYNTNYFERNETIYKNDLKNYFKKVIHCN